MPDKLITLVREVERLVTAPYVPSLQDLHDIVQDTPPAVIASWASCKPCQVGLLVDVLVEGLSRSNTALDLLGTFGVVPAVRDAVFERYPALVDRFLERAIENGQTEYIPACIALISNPLPANFVSPARLSPFIMNLIGQVGENPCEATISPLYKLMTGLQSSPGALNEIPSETMSTLQLELTKTLRNLDDHMGNLFCLATFARIANADIKHGPQAPVWLGNIRHFFGPKRGLKTLDLVVLRVILACSSSCNNLTVTKAAESVSLAIEVCDSVEMDRKQAWIAGNSSKIAKLHEKVMRDGIDQEVQMMGITFLVSLLPATAMPSEIPNLGLQGLVSMESTRVLEMIPSQLIPRLVEASVVSGRDTAIHTFLTYIISALKSERSMECNSMATVRLASLFLFSLRKLDSRPLGSTVRGLAPSLDTETMLELLDCFPKQPKSQCDGSFICDTEISALQSRLLVDLLCLYTLVSSEQGMNNNSATIPEAKVLTVFMAQVQKNIAGNKCAFTESKTLAFRDSPPLPNIRQSSASSYPRRDWRAGIAETLTINAHNLHENMMKNVQEICHDLERRCYDVEAPLRAVEGERDRFRVETEQLKQQRLELKDRVDQASGTISSLQDDLMSLEKQAENATTRAEEMSASLNAARKELEEQQRSSDESAEREREKARTRELDMMATLTEKEDQLEELQREVYEQRAENEEIRKTLDSVSKEKAVSLENAISLRQEISKLEEYLDSSKRILADKDDGIKQLLADKECANQERETLQKQVEEATSETNNLKSALCDATKHFGSEMEDLKQLHELHLSQAKTEFARQKEENKSLEATMHAAASNSNKELQSRDRKIHRLEKKVQSLQEERAAKAREYSEAQQHIGRLMNVMGFQRKPSEPKTPSKHRSSLNPLQEPATQRKIHLDEIDTQSQPDNLGEFVEPTTPSSSGRSPKRPRGSSSSQDPTPVPLRRVSTQKTKTLPTRSRTGQRQERKPLGEGDQNSQRKSQHYETSKLNNADSLYESQVAHNLDENRLQDIDLDTDLELKDFIFTSTCLSETNGYLDGVDD